MMTTRRPFHASAVFLAVVALALVPQVTWAHMQGGGPVGFGAGFLHPITGFDHLAAIVALGIMAARYHQGWKMFLLPVLFPTSMAVGAVAGLSGLVPPLVEESIALSVIVLGLLVALSQVMPLVFVAVATAVFAFFHGVAHGSEFAGGSAAFFILGFVVATFSLHLGSLFSAWYANRNGLTVAPRLAGAGIALFGVYVLLG